MSEQTIRKSEKLTREEHTRLVRWVRDQVTKSEAANLLGIQRSTLDRIIAVKSGNQATIDKIREIIHT